MSALHVSLSVFFGSWGFGRYWLGQLAACKNPAVTGDKLPCLADRFENSLAPQSESGIITGMHFQFWRRTMKPFQKSPPPPQCHQL